MRIETLLPATALVCRLPVVGVPIVEKMTFFYMVLNPRQLISYILVQNLPKDRVSIIFPKQKL